MKTSLTNHFDKSGDPMYTLAQLFNQYGAITDPIVSDTFYTNTLLSTYQKNVGLMNDSVLAGYPDTNFYDALNVACYLAWIGTDPTSSSYPASVPAAAKARFTYLANIVAGVTRFELKYTNYHYQAEELDGSGNPVKDSSGNIVYDSVLYLRKAPDSDPRQTSHFQLGLAYDLIYDWLTPPQATDARSYLFAVGNLYNTQGGGISIVREGVGSDNLNPYDRAPSASNQNGGDFPNLADGVDIPQLAIEGEESQISAVISGDPTDFGTYTPASVTTATWPYANDVCVNNGQRQIRNESENLTSVWGFQKNMFGYWQLGQGTSGPGELGFSRRGENQWVTTNLYQAFLSALYNAIPCESILNAAQPPNLMLLDHHDSGVGWTNGLASRNEMYIAKYMYPDDPMVDYVYRAMLATAHQGTSKSLLTETIFSGVLQNSATLSQVAAAKNIALTKLDPYRGVAITRNGWAENDLNFQFENFPAGEGHYHAEANDFSLYALGRAWSYPPGYHVTPGDAESEILIQQKHPAVNESVTQNYLGEGPGVYNLITDPAFTGGPFHGSLLDVNEDPNKLWTWAAGDAKSTYDYVEGGKAPVSTGIFLSDLFYKGIFSTMIPSDIASYLDHSSGKDYKGTPFNPVKYAFRSVFVARGTNPYVLIFDDIDKDDTPTNYRWVMSACVGFGGGGGLFVENNNTQAVTSLQIEPNSTSTSAILYHDIDAASTPGLPRLLVRDLNGNVPASSPAIRIEDRPGNGSTNLTYGYDNNLHTNESRFPSRRLFIDRNGVTTPNFKVLLFPFLTATSPLTPVTSWNGNVLTVKIGSQTDTVTLDPTNSDHRTRLVSFTRSTGAALPKLNLPGNITAAATGLNSSGVPTATVSFSISANSSTGSSITPGSLPASGSVFAAGVNIVSVSATDRSGQEVTGSFTVTVTPPPPTIAASLLRNLGSTNDGLTLTWPYTPGVTGYNVKMATSASGPFTTVSGGSNVAPVANSGSNNSFTINGLSGANYYFAVTSLLSPTTFESSASNIISLEPVNQGGLIAEGIGLTSGIGGSTTGSGATGYTYKLDVTTTALNSATNGTSSSIGGSNDNAAVTLMPWTGDGTFTARLASFVPPSGHEARAVIDFRSTTASNSPQVAIGYDDNNSSQTANLIGRQANGSSNNLNSTDSVPVPSWYRLVRQGNLFTGSYSSDGVAWSQLAPITDSMPAAGLVGLGTGATTSGVNVAASFDNATFLATPTVTSSDGIVFLDWSGSSGALSYSVQRSTTGLAGSFTTLPTATALNTTKFTDVSVENLILYYYQIVAASANGTSTSPIVSIRPAATSSPVVTTTPGNQQITLNWPAASRAATYAILKTGFSGYLKTGITSTSFTDTGLTNGNVYTYEVVAANSSGTYGYPSIPVSAVPINWIDLNIGTDFGIGTNSLLGTDSYLNGVFKITGSGSDIWTGADNFNFVYRPWKGDGTFITHLASITTNDTSSKATAKAGVMFRGSTNAGAQNVIAFDSLTNSGLHFRTTTNGGTGGNGGSGPGAPNWLRLERSGSSFTAFTSADGISWSAIGGSQTNVITDPGVVGLAVCAVNKSALCTALFDSTAFLVIPQGLSASNVAGTALDLNWTINPQGNLTDATSLQLESSPSGTNQWTVISSTLPLQLGSYKVTGLAFGTSYTFRLKELGGTVSGDYATLQSTTLKANLPLAPTGLAGTFSGTAGIQLNWTDPAPIVTSGAATSYQVAISTTSFTSGFGTPTVLGSTATSDLLTGLTPGKTYYIQVSAVNAGGTKSAPAITLTMPIPSNFSNWVLAHHLKGNNTSESASYANDGVSNVLKFLCDIDPTPPISPADRQALPTLNVVQVNGTEYLSLSYRQNSAALGLNVTLQKSADLIIWTDVSPPNLGPVIVPTSSNDPNVQVGVIKSGSRQFIRLKISSNSS